MGRGLVRPLAVAGFAFGAALVASCASPTQGPRRSVMPISNFDPGGSEWRRRAESPRPSAVASLPVASPELSPPVSGTSPPEASAEPLPEPTLVATGRGATPPEAAPPPVAAEAAPPPVAMEEGSPPPIIDIDLLEVVAERPEPPPPPAPAPAPPAPAPPPPAPVAAAAAAAPRSEPLPPTAAEASAASVAAIEPMAPVEAAPPTSPAPTVGTLPQPSPREAASPVRAIASPSAASISILRRAARSDDAALQANALESLLTAPAVLEEVLPAALADPNRGVRFVAAICVGDAGLRQLAHLVEPLLQDSSDSVRAAALYALQRCGRRVDLTPLARMVRSNDPEVRANAFMVLGKLGNPSAVGLIRSSLGGGMTRVNPIRVRIVELQAAEALLQLGQDEEIEAVRAALFAPVEQGELSILGCQILQRIGDQSSGAMLERLVEASGQFARPPEIRLAAAEALASLSLPVRFDLAGIAEEASNRPEPLLRVQAAAVLGSLGGARSMERLSQMLSDPDPAVRVAAAGNLLRLSPEGAASATGGIR